jgi:DNA topoisomerase-1
VACQSLGALSHTTQPPARYTDASLIKKLEEMGIGRPSTYASIISVITERGYVRKQGRQLIPTFLAVMTMEVLQNHFGEFVEYDFTRELDESLDDIANGKSNRIAYLEAFFLGHGDQPGLKAAVESRKREIPYPNFHVGDHPDSGKPIIVRLGKGGDPFLQLGDAEEKTFASVPEDLAPGDLTLEHALELFDKKPRQAESIGVHPASGRNLLLKQRQGYYLEVERTPEEIEAKVKPTWVSLPQNVDPRTLTQNDLDYLCSLPKEIGKHTDSGAPITFHLGKFGPYIQCEKEIRNVADWRGGLTLAVGEAVAILAAPKTRGARAATGPLQDFGELDGAAGAVRVLAGRFGPYVTDGEVNATLPRGTDPLSLTAERALELLAAKRAAGPSTKPSKRGARGRTTAARPAAAKKAPAKKPGAKKSTTKKPKK